MMSADNRLLMLKYLDGTATAEEISKLATSVGGRQELERMVEAAWDRTEAEAGRASLGLEPQTTPPEVPAAISDWEWWRVAGVRVEIDPIDNGWFVSCFEFDLGVEAPTREEGVDELIGLVKEACHEIEAYDGEVGGRVAWQKQFLADHGGAASWLPRFGQAVRERLAEDQAQAEDNSEPASIIEELTDVAGSLRDRLAAKVAGLGSLVISPEFRPSTAVAFDADEPSRQVEPDRASSEDGLVEALVMAGTDGVVRIRFSAKDIRSDIGEPLLVRYSLRDSTCAEALARGWCPLAPALDQDGLEGHIAVSGLPGQGGDLSLEFRIAPCSELANADPGDVAASVDISEPRERRAWLQLVEEYDHELPESIVEAIRTAAG